MNTLNRIPWRTNSSGALLVRTSSTTRSYFTCTSSVLVLGSAALLGSRSSFRGNDLQWHVHIVLTTLCNNYIYEFILSPTEKKRIYSLYKNTNESSRLYVIGFNGYEYEDLHDFDSLRNSHDQLMMLSRVWIVR